MSDALPLWRLAAVAAEPMQSWVEMLRDANPIHVDPAAAEALGFGPHTVNPGPANLAYAINLVMAARPGSYPREIRAHFLGNILSGDAVEVGGVAVTDTPDHYRVQVRVAAHDRIAVEAEIVAPLRDDRA